MEGDPVSGQAESLRVAVVTPYYHEALEVLQKCHESVRQQTHPAVHFLVADGFSRPEVLNWSAERITLSRAHADGGDTPRGVGSLSAMNPDFDAIAFLDADNWYLPDHIESMMKLHRQTGACVCTATRNIHRLDGSFMYVDNFDSDGHKFVDTNCLFLTRGAFEILPLWAMMPKELAPSADRVIWSAIVRRGYSRAHCPEPTVAFRTQYQAHYHYLHEPAPPNAKTIAEFTAKADSWWLALPDETRRKWERYFYTRFF
jgi:glycosyltransferase involved in cell wall biosynthesis